jgi:hypothetical protein
MPMISHSLPSLMIGAFKNNFIPMNYDLELLETLVHWMQKHPAILKQENLLKDETRQLEKVMLHHLMSLTNETQIETYLQINLFKLVEICDALFQPDDAANANAAAVLDLFLSLIKTSKSTITKEIQIPLLLRKRLGENFESEWQDVIEKMNNNGIDAVLIEIITFGYLNFKTAKNIPKWSQKTYLSFFIEVLSEIKDEADLEYVIKTLIRLEYNYSRFTAYCYRWLKSRITGLDLETKTKSILELKKELRQLEVISDDRFDPRKLSIVDELCKWLDEEQLALYNEVAPNTYSNFKLNTTLKVLELAYWEKLQYDNGVYEEANLDILSEKIAHNFSSKFQEELSAPSIKSKFYPKDRSIIEPIETLLVKMLADVRQFLQ